MRISLHSQEKTAEILSLQGSHTRHIQIQKTDFVYVQTLIEIEGTVMLRIIQTGTPAFNSWNCLICLP